MEKQQYMPPETSLTAYSKVKAEGKDVRHRDMVYNSLLTRKNRIGTATDITLGCNLDYHEVNRRIKECINEGRIEIFSEKGGRSRDGNPCRVYRAISKDAPVSSVPKPAETVIATLF